MVSRDARHHALADVGVAGQKRIAAGTALIIGAGGIGTAASTYLAASGVGRILLADFDTVDETNLGRQFLYTPDDVGALKAEIAAIRLRANHPHIIVDVLANRMAGDALLSAASEADVVLDGCDNFATRFAVNDVCVQLGRTLVSGAAIRMEGQLAVYGPDYGSSSCYRCLYSEVDETLDDCSGNGVLSPVTGVVGTLMAVETLKILARLSVIRSRLLLYDARASEFHTVQIPKDSACIACGASD